MMHTLFYRLGMVAILIAIALLVYTFYLISFPKEVIHVNVQPNKVLTPVVEQGGTLKFTFDYCRLHPYTSTLSRTIRNDTFSFPLPSFETAGQTGCFVLDAHVPIPEGLPAGRYYLLSVNTTRINSFNTVVTQHETEWFEVVEKQ